MSGLYDNYKATAMGGGVGVFVNLDNTSIIRAGITCAADYTENLTTDQDWDDVGAYALNKCYNSEDTQILANTTTAAGVFDADDITFVGVDTTGNNVDALVHYDATGTLADDTLICFHDGFTAVVPNGGDIVIVYDGAGIFAF